MTPNRTRDALVLNSGGGCGRTSVFLPVVSNPGCCAYGTCPPTAASPPIRVLPSMFGMYFGMYFDTTGVCAHITVNSTNSNAPSTPLLCVDGE
jgi:hypothetical protein